MGYFANVSNLFVASMWIYSICKQQASSSYCKCWAWSSQWEAYLKCNGICTCSSRQGGFCQFRTLSEGDPDQETVQSQTGGGTNEEAKKKLPYNLSGYT